MWVMSPKDISSLKLILSVVDPDYPNSIQISTAVKNKNLFNESIKLAIKNGLYYLFVIKLNELNLDLPFLEEDYWNNEEKELIEFKNTLKFLSKFSNDINYILIKSCITIPHVPRDVDIFVCTEKMGNTLEFLRKAGMKFDQKCDGETSLKKEGFLKIDIYNRICYFNVDFFEQKFLINSIKKSNIFNIECVCLDKEAEFLLLLVHSIFGHGRLSLLDFLYLKSLRRGLDINACRKYASEKSWGSVFDMILNKFDSINDAVYIHDDVVIFPYLIDLDFIMECLLCVDGLRINRLDKSILLLCLNFERIIELNTDSPIYNLCKSFPPTRKLANYSLSFFRTMRGDEKK